MGYLTDFAKKEFEIYFNKEEIEDGYNKDLMKATFELLKVFENQNHSNCSASMVRELFYKLSKFQTLSPLKFTDEEWCNNTNFYQNKRLASVFKDEKDGIPYVIDAVLFCDGIIMSTSCSKFFIYNYKTKPFFYKNFYIKIDKNGNIISKPYEIEEIFDYFGYNEEQKNQKLKEIKNYYKKGE